ncbi:DUF4397 domain-containing protein [Mucilaginibacter agri]|uniref:DUF4397 domain-containing protein n=1 Tax=Mucilaginibacter agri TaxID=2695265 RepID=A0A966DT57_9SPHI|nr:DUF4397 domain-containing protein [Mucilaginibacter agri]NCD70898.1 DUF4397 domain-containing protein [Mucilaginibacter agri]
MAEKSNTYIGKMLTLLVAGIMIAPLITSCGKTSTGTANSYNSRLVVANLSPDIMPVDLYIDNKIQNPGTGTATTANVNAYRFPTPTDYVYLQIINSPLQIRSDTGQRSVLFSTDSVPHQNSKYTLFVTGMKADNNIGYVFLTDTDKVAPVGRGKIRFVNASPRSGAFDIYANQTIAFKNIAFNKVSPWLEMPAGDYDFKIYANGDQTTVLKEVKQTISDSRLYTMYSYGIVGRTDTAAFNTGLITNK